MKACSYVSLYHVILALLRHSKLCYMGSFPRKLKRIDDESVARHVAEYMLHATTLFGNIARTRKLVCNFQCL